MNTAVVEDRFKLIVCTKEASPRSFADDVAEGLSGDSKRIPSLYFYDHRGSLLFEDICELKEYYLTRAEREILEASADEITSLFPKGADLVELGSGSSRKTRLLIESFLRNQGRLRYDPIDISRKMIEGSSISLLKRYPDLEIQAIAGEYTDGLETLSHDSSKAKLIVWLGSSIGNLTRREATDFLKHIRQTMSPKDSLLVGIDLRKSKEVLERAYDDAEGVTARFNMNLLHRINQELGGDFVEKNFAHRALYHEEKGVVEMRLVCDRATTVRIEAIDREVTFQKGETILTEQSFKYSPEEIQNLLREAGLEQVHQWFDSQDRFSLTLANSPAEAGE